MQSPIENCCIYASFYGIPKKQLMPKVSLRVYVQEIHNSMLSPQEEGGLKYSRYADNNIIISDSTLRHILPPQLKNMNFWYKVIFGCKCCMYSKSMHSSSLSWRDRYPKNSNIKVVTRKTEGLVKYPINYLRHIKILSWHMVSIYSTHHLIWIWQQCVNIYHQNMHYHIWNMFCIAVHNVHVLKLQVHNQIIRIPVLVHQYIFMCINKLQYAMWMSDTLSMKIKCVNFVRLTLIQF